VAALISKLQRYRWSLADSNARSWRGIMRKLPSFHLTTTIIRASNYRMIVIEIAARALCQAQGQDENTLVNGSPAWRAYVPQVMTVLIAIHEPSDIMKEAGAEIVRHVGEEESDYAHQSDAANIWRFMIDAMRRDS